MYLGKLTRLGLAAATIIVSSPADAQFRVVNMIPKEYSYEKEASSEVTLSVNRENAKHIAATAMFHDEYYVYPSPSSLCRLADGYSLLVQSFDAGATWQHVCGIPVAANDRYVGDPTMRFAGSTLFTAYLNPGVPSGTLRPMTIASWDESAAAVSDPLTRMNWTAAEAVTKTDQPQLDAGIFDDPGGFGKRTYIFVANAIKKPDFVTSVDHTLDAFPATGLPAFVTEDVEHRRKTVVRAMRLAMHSSGVGYAAFYRRDRDQSPCANLTVPTCAATYDVVVVRGALNVIDNGMTRTLQWPGFKAIKEKGDCASSNSDCCTSDDDTIGVRVMRCTHVFEMEDWSGYQLHDLAVNDLAIAVDPADWRRVFVAFAVGKTWYDYRVGVRRSVDGGETWSTELWAVARAINPALAIDTQGRVGFLYQRLEETPNDPRWKTEFALSADDFASNTIISTIASHRADTPDGPDPYLGDYHQLESVGGMFYGSFAASNEPKASNFPKGITFARPAIWSETDPKLIDETGSAVAVSIDPYFFSVNGANIVFCDKYRYKMLTTIFGRATASVIHTVSTTVNVAATLVSSRGLRPWVIYGQFRWPCRPR